MPPKRIRPVQWDMFPDERAAYNERVQQQLQRAQEYIAEGEHSREQYLRRNREARDRVIGRDVLRMPVAYKPGYVVPRRDPPGIDRWLLRREYGGARLAGPKIDYDVLAQFELPEYIDVELERQIRFYESNRHIVGDAATDAGIAAARRLAAVSKRHAIGRGSYKVTPYGSVGLTKPYGRSGVSDPSRYLMFREMGVSQRKPYFRAPEELSDREVKNYIRSLDPLIGHLPQYIHRWPADRSRAPRDELFVIDDGVPQPAWLLTDR